LRWGLLLGLCSFPIAGDLIKDFRDFVNKKRLSVVCMRLLPQKTAQFNLWYGLLLMGGLLPLPVLARTMLASLFYLGGGNNVYTFGTQWKLTHYKLNYLLDSLFEISLPRVVTGVLLFVATMTQTLCSMFFIAGYYTVETAWIMLLFLATITPIIHNFWVEDPHPEDNPLLTKKKDDLVNIPSTTSAGASDIPQQKYPYMSVTNSEVPVFNTSFDSEFVHFWKNVCIMGGMLVYITCNTSPQ
jgi:uncharacterized membrane protein YphA (DoxX/SURF4 family)